MKIYKLRNIVWLLSVFTMNAGAAVLTDPKTTDLWESCVNAGIVSSPASSINLADIIYNEWDSTLVGGSISNSNPKDTCSFTAPNAVYVNGDCSVTGDSRNTFDLQTLLDGKNLAAGSIVTTANTEASALQPGVYNSIELGTNAGTIWMAPGDYYIDTFTLGSGSNMQVVGDTGTVNLYINTIFNAGGGSAMNHPLMAPIFDPIANPTFVETSTKETPNRLTILTGATAFQAGSATIVGFIYVAGNTLNVNLNLWGAMSSNRFTLQNGGSILCGTKYAAFIETGPGLGGLAETPLPAGWHLIGIPADTDGTVTFDQVFKEPEFLVGGIGSGAGWWAYERTFSSLDNSAAYEQVTGVDTPAQSQGYWLYNVNDVNWSVAGLNPVVWEIDQGVKGCTAISKCTSYTMTLPSSGCAVYDKTGPLRYNYIGYPGIVDANWTDFRIAVTDSLGAMTTETPGDTNYMSATIYQYNGTPETTSNTYDPCDNSGLAPCVITPYTGFLVELNCSIVDDGVQKIELIIPNLQ